MCRDKTVFCKGEYPRRDQAVEVEMVHEVLRPSVEHGNEPNFAMKVPGGVFGKSSKCFLDRTKEDIEGNSFVAEYNRVKLMGQGEDQVKVTAGKQFCLAVIEPPFFDQGLAFGAMPVPA
jgi:hypothetical protein